jgi:ABC-2 type transport system ATP-binding protein
VAVIEVRNLYKRYGDIEAVSDVSLSVDEGEVFALLGPNGAGKSTTVEILEGHRERSSGEVSVLGMDPAAAGRDYRDRVGIVLQSSGIEEELTVAEAVSAYGASYSNRRSPDEVLELVGLTEKADQRVKHLSGGQQRRIDLALGLIGNPKVLFLDEPTTGFDPAARRQSWDLVANLRSVGTAVLLTTHYMDEAEHLADRVAVIVKGEIVAEGTPSELMAAAGETVITFRLPAETSTEAMPLPGLVRDGDALSAHSDTPTEALHRLTGWALEHNTELIDLSVHRPSFEDVYLELASESAVGDP